MNNFLADIEAYTFILKSTMYKNIREPEQSKRHLYFTTPRPLKCRYLYGYTTYILETQAYFL